MKKLKVIVCMLVAVVLLSFTLPSQFNFSLPSHFPSSNNKTKFPDISSEKIELGRRLFYDPILSADSSISCSSCHSSYNAFAHTDHALSHGIHDSVGRRNAPALFNLAWQQEMMWDGAISSLKLQALAPIHSSSEMGSNIQEVLTRLNASENYQNLFAQAFKSKQISTASLLEALQCFQLSLISSNAKYDRVQLGRDTFNDMEQKGYILYQQHCRSCHLEPLFSTYSFAKNHLPINENMLDLGRYEVTNSSGDSLKFKVPSLRNLAFTYPYMHDGRFNTLSQVIDHYRSLAGMQINDFEKAELLAFLKSLNDYEFAFNQQHAFPREMINQTKNIQQSQIKTP